MLLRCTIRPIRPEDDPAVARIIREVMPEFGAGGPGFAICDAEVDTMWGAYQGPDRAYWVVDGGDEVLGGGGFAPLAGGPPGVCELKKMYFLPRARGLGLGRELLELAVRSAGRAGYERMYLETLATMTAARRLYERAGFRCVPSPRGCTGHHGCDTFYELELGSWGGARRRGAGGGTPSRAGRARVRTRRAVSPPRAACCKAGAHPCVPDPAAGPSPGRPHRSGTKR